MASVKGKSLCISSSKGGVGKSFIITSLAGIFASINKKVLIIDFDLSGGSIAVSLNTPFEKSLYNLVDDYDNNRYKKFEDYVTKYEKNEYIDFIASPKDPRQAIKIDSRFIEIILDKAVNNYDVVLIDTNHDLNEFNISLMDKVDQILFVLTNDIVKELFDIRSQQEFENKVKDSIITRDEKDYIIQAIRDLGLNDYNKIRYIEKYVEREVM